MRIRGASTATWTVLGVTLAAGGLFASGAFAQDTSYRITTIDYDYDDNGVADAQTTVAYDAAGNPTDITYTYTDDGETDLFVTQDDESSSEIGTFGFDAAGLTTSSTLDRVNMDASTESFDLLQTWLGGQLTLSESETNFAGAVTLAYSTFAYAGGNLDQVDERRTSDDALQFTMNFEYGGDSLPDTATLTSPSTTVGFPGLEIATTYSWRPDGQVDDVTSVWSQLFPTGPVVFGGGAGDYIYDAAGRRVAEVFTVDTSQGAFVAEFFGRNYRKTLHYDALGLLAMEEIDLEDDGSIEATRTTTWEAGDCTEAFVWAPNGRPDFVETAGLPYVPGAGWQSLRNCPEPAQGLSLLAGVGGLCGLARRRRPRAAPESRREALASRERTGRPG